MKRPGVDIYIYTRKSRELSDLPEKVQEIGTYEKIIALTDKKAA